MVARRPIGFEAGSRRKIGRGFLDVMPMLLVKLTVPPLKACAFEEAQCRTGIGVKSNAFVVCQFFNVLDSQSPNPRKISAFDNLHRYLQPIVRMSLRRPGSYSLGVCLS